MLAFALVQVALLVGGFIAVTAYQALVLTLLLGWFAAPPNNLGYFDCFLLSLLCTGVLQYIGWITDVDDEGKPNRRTPSDVLRLMGLQVIACCACYGVGLVMRGFA